VTYDLLPEVARMLTQGDGYAVQAIGDQIRLRRQRPMSGLLLEALRATPARPQPSPSVSAAPA
jgi:hypothetical protein